MSERKVLNKYYPPDFDPSAIPKMRFSKNRTFNIRIMAPFNMRCNTCGGYIYKGKKFNSRKENVDEEFYLGLRIFRFYIKCPTCVAEIAFKHNNILFKEDFVHKLKVMMSQRVPILPAWETDLKNTDYTLEAGATRLFEAEKIAKEMAEREIKEKEEEELNNPMKILENRTKASRNEIETIDILEELRELSARQATVKTETMLKQHQEYEQYLQKLQEEEEEKEIRSIFGERENGKILKRLKDDEEDEDEPKAKKVVFPPKATDMLSTEPTNGTNKSEKKPTASWQRSVGGLSSSRGLKNLVRKKQTKTSSASSGNENAAGNTDIKADNGTIANSALQPGIQCEEKISENTNGDTNEVCTVPASKSDSPQSITKGNEPPVGVNQPKPSSDSSAVSSSSASLSAPVPSGSALGLLGLGYSDSDESDD